MLPIIPVLWQICCFLTYRNEKGVWVMIPITSGSHGSIALFEKSSALTPREEGNGGHEDLHKNPERIDVSEEVSDKCIQIFLSTFCQCSLRANEQPCSFLLWKVTVVELRFQCLELMADQLDMLILSRPDGHTKERADMKRSCSHYLLRGHQVSRKTFLFLHCISKKRDFSTWNVT